MRAVCWRWACCGIAAFTRDAQEFPTKPITFIVPWSAGGATDIVCRALAAAAKHLVSPLSSTTDQRWRHGGPRPWRTAKPDGYTIAQCDQRVPLSDHAVRGVYDPLKDFTYIANISGYVFAIMPARRQLPVAGRHRFRQGQSRQGHLRDARRRTSPNIGTEVIGARRREILYAPFKARPR